MKYLKLFENFEILNLEYLKLNFPIKIDESYKKVFGKERYYININYDIYYYQFDENGLPAYGFNNVKTVLVNWLETKGLITDKSKDTRLIKEYLKSVSKLNENFQEEEIRKCIEDGGTIITDKIIDLNRKKEDLEVGEEIEVKPVSIEGDKVTVEIEGEYKDVEIKNIKRILIP